MTVPTRSQLDSGLWSAVGQVVTWLDHHNGTGPDEAMLRFLKVAEEYGEASQAWIGATGQNPRKGISASMDDVAAELSDVVIAAAVALVTITGDPTSAGNALTTRLDRVLTRIGAHQ